LSTTNFNTISSASDREIGLRASFGELFRRCPIPQSELLDNVGLFARRQLLSRIFWMAELYRKVLPVHGVVMEFGVRWGQNLVLFHSFRGMWEPFNYSRKIVGFDTFGGFPSEAIDNADGGGTHVVAGGHGVSEAYELYLDRLLEYHESESPISHVRKYHLVKGDVSTTVPSYLKENPETIVALAYFDLDLYKPTKECLKAILPHLTKGSVLGFDEVGFHSFPGETAALKEVLGLDKYRIQRIGDLCPFGSYIQIE
jgi:hypothetical protein